MTAAIRTLPRAAHLAVCLGWLAFLGPVLGQSLLPAEIALRRADGEPLTTVELGDVLDLEVAIEAGDDSLTGFTFFLAFDPRVFRVAIPPGAGTTGEPFTPGGWLDGVVLLNRMEEGETESFLSYAEAAGVQRRAVTGSGVAARFSLEAIRRPLGNLTHLRIVERGHDRVSAYTATRSPGTELRFGPPLGSAAVRITGFKIQPLPDVRVVEGDGVQVAFEDLGDFVDQVGAQVIWSASFVEGLGTDIDRDGRVTVNPVGIVGDTTVTFTAFEVEEGNEDAGAVRVTILSRPRVVGLPPVVTFPEDGASTLVDLDDFVIDLDDPVDSLSWTPTNGTFVRVDIDPDTRQAVFSAAPDSAGEGEIRLVVSDRMGLTDTVVTRVVVTPVNDPPLVRRRPPIYPRLGAAGGVVLPLSELIADADDPPDSLQILLQAEGGVQAELTGDGQGVEVAGDAAGRGVVRIIARDRSGEVATGRVVAVVLPEGTTLAPEIAALPELRFVEGLAGTLDLKRLVTDDSPASALSWTAASFDRLRPVVRDGVLLVTAEAGFVGPAAVGLIVTDPDGNQDSASLAIEVLPAGVPQAPRIFGPPKIGLASSDVAGGNPRHADLDLDALVEDPDGRDEDIVWTVTASRGVAVDFDPETRHVRVSASDGLDEVGTLSLTATDGDGLSDTRTIQVLAVPGDGAPRIGQLDGVVLDSDAAVGRVDLDDVVFDDEDFESELEWSVEAEPGIQVDLDPVTHLLRVRRDDLGGAQPPSEARVVLTVRDTRGRERSAILNVALPPVFQLRPIPDLVIFAGGEDSSLVLRDHVVQADLAPALTWTVAPPAQLAVSLDSASTRVRVRPLSTAFVGSEILRFTATDPTGRARTVSVRVQVKGRGLTPQIRAFPALAVRAGQEDRSIDLDDFVVDDDPDSTLTWSVGEPADVKMEVDPITHELVVRPLDLAIGPRTAQLLVVDPAGNSALGFLEVSVLRGGEPPVVSGLPQVLLPAGGPEQALSLDLFVEDADTPDDQIRWTARAEPGVAARIEGRRLLVSVPAGQQGTRRVVLIAEDPQGNRDEDALTVLIQIDDEPPGFSLEVARDPVVTDLVDVTIRPSEDLDGPPAVRIDGRAAEAREVRDGTWVASFSVPPIEGDQSLAVEVTGTDRAGNLGRRTADVVLRRLARTGGSVSTPDGQASLNVPGAVAGPGRLVVLYRLADEDLPPGAGTGAAPVYSVDVAAGATLAAPVTLNLFAGTEVSDPTRGIERWDPATATWQDVPAAADEDSGWISAAVREPGLYRLGPVAAEQRRPAASLGNYPNPFNAAGGAQTRIEYEVTADGPVRLEIYNTLGQLVRVLVDEGMQDVGVWTVGWDGLDGDGRRLGTGVYFYRLHEAGATRVRQLLLLR